ncbi:protein pns1 [Phtheirospermum japonicum]|uniref:Choline transporter-like protein n=1 Tax=Phtheirospermum japonicum TaxID=374723 RepID=A0A830BAF0_9LAMI|nr:protein pns1 [Phtheirospermum japonicum]
MPRKGSNFINKLFQSLFYTHLVLITALAIFLTLRAILSSAHTHRFHPKQWYLIVLSSTALSGITGFSYQALTGLNPSTAFKTTFWLSPLLTCAFGVLLVLISTPASLAASVITLICSILQSLYACWANPRFEHAGKILTVSLTYYPPKVNPSVILSIVISILFSSLLMSGIGGATATGTKIDTLFVFLILVSLTWTMQIIKNTMQVTVSHVKYMQFACGIEVDFKTVVKNASRYSMGSICMGSILVPVITVIRGWARAVSLVSGDVDEFMFSCASCCLGAASRIVTYGNRWGFVHVGVYNKGIVRASMDTWEMFTRIGIEELVNHDLTSSFCFLCGVATGSICGLVGGTWALLVHKTYATEVSIYVFLVGYFTNRVAMAWVQASITAYYVAYAENPESQQFDNTIPAYIHELQRSQV